MKRSYYRVGIDTVLPVQEESGVKEDEPSNDEHQGQETHQILCNKVVYESYEHDVWASRSRGTFMVQKIDMSQDQHKTDQRHEKM